MRPTSPAPVPSARRRRLVGRVLVVPVAIGALLLVTVAPAAAKEFLQARLEAPISFQSPPGAELDVAVLVTVPDGAVNHPVDGSPIWLRLIGPHGDTTEAPGTMGTGPGRYVMRIEVPAGGPRRLEVFMRGTGDLPILLSGDPFTFRAMGAGTAQLAPALPAATSRAPAAATPATDGQSATTPVAVPGIQPWLLPVAVIAALAALAIGVVAVAGRLRSRRGSLQGS